MSLSLRPLSGYNNIDVFKLFRCNAHAASAISKFLGSQIPAIG